MILPKLIMVEKTLLTCYRYCTILIKSRYTNKGGTIGQHAIKGITLSFAQNLECNKKFKHIIIIIIVMLIDIIATGTFCWKFTPTYRINQTLQTIICTQYYKMRHSSLWVLLDFE
jgi:hypothetical protein